MFTAAVIVCIDVAILGALLTVFWQSSDRRLGSFSATVGTRLLRYCSMDVVLVAIDFENGAGICGAPLTQKISGGKFDARAGVAILDTRNLDDSQESPITTHQFCIGSNEYCNTASKKLLFGTSESVTMEALTSKLEKLLRFTDPSTGDLRPIVIIGHNLQVAQDGNTGDVSCLRKLICQKKISPIIAFLDTVEDFLSDYPPGPLFGLRNHFEKAPSLKKLLTHLGIPSWKLHVAGNDANFTLRAILRMAVRENEEMGNSINTAEEEMLRKLDAIATEFNPAAEEYARKLDILSRGEKKTANKVKDPDGPRAVQEKDLDGKNAARKIRRLNRPGSFWGSLCPWDDEIAIRNEDVLPDDEHHIEQY